MLKKDIKYADFNGVEREESYYFNLSKAELMEMELGTVGGFTEMVNKIIATQDTPALVKIFKDMILKSYGIKSQDGKRFEKSKEISEAFMQTEAYSTLFMELATNTDAAVEFINGIVPAEISEKMKAQKASEEDK